MEILTISKHVYIHLRSMYAVYTLWSALWIVLWCYFSHSWRSTSFSSTCLFCDASALLPGKVFQQLHTKGIHLCMSRWAHRPIGVCRMEAFRLTHGRLFQVESCRNSVDRCFFFFALPDISHARRPRHAWEVAPDARSLRFCYLSTYFPPNGSWNSNICTYICRFLLCGF